MIAEKYPGYCDQCKPGLIGDCSSCFRDIGRPPSNLWYDSHESRQDRIDKLIKELAYQAENPPNIELSQADKEIWEDYTKKM